MSLYLSEEQRATLERTNMGKEVLQQLQKTEEKYSELLKYGKTRVLSCIPLDLYAKIKKQEGITCNNLAEYLIRPKHIPKKDVLIKSLKALHKGYGIVIETAIESGLEKIDIDFFNITKSNGDEIFVVPDRNTKAIIEEQHQDKPILVYTMQELCHLISGDEMQYELKKNFQATVEQPKLDDEEIPF